MIEYPNVSLFREVEPSDSRERFHYRLTKIAEKLVYNIVDEKLLCRAKEEAHNICLSMVNEGVFPMELWSIDSRISVTAKDFGNIDVKFPKWVEYWMDTGELMTSYQVHEYLDKEKALEAPEKDCESPVEGLVEEFEDWHFEVCQRFGISLED